MIANIAGDGTRDRRGWPPPSRPGVRDGKVGRRWTGVRDPGILRVLARSDEVNSAGTSHPDLFALEQQRHQLHAHLAQIGDFRPGSLAAVRRRCGKPACACNDPAHPGHGPQHLLTKKVEGKTVTVHVKPGSELQKVAGEVANYRLFKAMVGEIIQVSEQICEARPVGEGSAPAAPPAGGQRGGSSGTSRRSSRRR